MLDQLRILPSAERLELQPDELVATLDVQYSGEDAFVAIDLLRWGSDEHVQQVFKEKVEVDYEPGFFAFREGPLLQNALNKLTDTPRLLIVDGHGTGASAPHGACLLARHQNGLALHWCG